MPRTTALAVGGIIDVDAGDDLTPYIETANLLVTDVCTSSGYSSAKLELIERWLASHAYDVNRPREQAEAVNPGPSVSYERVKVDLGLHNTKYGQMAMFLDTAGNLAALQNALNVVKKNPTALTGVPESRWLGTSD